MSCWFFVLRLLFNADYYKKNTITFYSYFNIFIQVNIGIANVQLQSSSFLQFVSVASALSAFVIGDSLVVNLLLDVCAFQV